MISDLTGDLAQLERGQLIRRLAETEPAFSFKHVMVQEAAYESLLRNDRRELHASVGRALEELYPSQPEEMAALLGMHFREAGDFERALRYFSLAAESDSRRYAIPEAIAQYSHAIEVAQTLGVSSAQLIRSRGRAFETIGDFERSRSDLEGALKQFEAEGDDRHAWETLLDLGLLWAGRDYARAGEYYRRAYERAQALGDRATLGYSLNRLGNWHANIEQPSDALRLLDQAMGMFEELENSRGLADTLDLLGMTNLMRGDAARSRRHYLQALEHFRRDGDLRRVASVLTSLSFQASTSPAAGEGPNADGDRRAAEEALEITRRIGWPAGESYALWSLAARDTVLGNYVEALTRARQALHIARHIAHAQWVAGASVILGSIHLDLLDYTSARTFLTSALSTAREVNSVWWIRNSAGLLGSVLIGLGELAEARRILDDALPANGPPQTVAQRLVYLARAELALAEGKPRQALQIVEAVQASAGGPADLLYARYFLRAPLLHARALSEVAREAGPGSPEGSRAEQALRDLQSNASQLGALPTLWRAHWALGRHLQASGRAPEAQAEFRQAQAIAARLAEPLVDEAMRNTFLRQVGSLLS